MRRRKMANRSHAVCGDPRTDVLIAVEQPLYLIAGQPPLCAAAGRLPALLNERNHSTMRKGFSQYKGVNEAPIMAPGFSKLPLCKITAMASTPSNFIASTGTAKFSLFPFQLPSLTHRRTTFV
jgi:hypothetical protein